MDGVMVALAGLIGLLVGLVAGAWWAARAAAALRAELAGARAEATADAEARAAAEARLSEVLSQAERLVTETQETRRLHDAILNARNEAETQMALARQETAGMRARMADWEATKAEFMKSTQAGVLETAQQISSKLLEDHKRETEAAKLAAEARIAEKSARLQEDMQALNDGVAQLKGQVAEKAQMLDVVRRALSSPSGAGYYAEVGLANTLKSFGLTEERDFVLQQTVYGPDAQRKRPDAIVFLPGNAVLVIDSKASKYLLALAEAEGTDGEEEAYQSLARTMNQHLKDLGARDYRGAVQEGFRKAGKPGEIARLIMVMYLPNEGAVEKLGKADPGFMHKAAEAQVTPAGPAGLSSIIGFSSIEISMVRQMENQSRIIGSAERLLESLTIAVGHAGAVGRGIRQAAEGFARLTNSINGRVLPRAREMHKLGLRPPKPLPPNLAAYQVLELGADTIDGEATDLIEDVVLPPPAESEEIR